MNVSDIAREVGIAPSAVRFYERRGIVPAAHRRDNGYREYTSDDLCRLRVVVSLRSLGLDLDADGRLAETPRGPWTRRWPRAGSHPMRPIRSLLDEAIRSV